MTLEADLLRFINTEITLDPSVEADAETDLLLTDLVDSLGMVEVVAWLEDYADVQIDLADVVLENFQTVARMTAFIDRLRSAGVEQR